MDEKSEEPDLILTDEQQPDFEKSEVDETPELITSCDIKNNNDEQDVDCATAPEGRAELSSAATTCDSPAPKCKLYYLPDGTVYAFESSSTSSNVERILTDQQCSANELTSLPTTLCYVKLTPCDDESSLSNTVIVTYKIIEAQKFLSEFNTNEFMSDVNADQNVFMCFLCNGTKFSSLFEFDEHIERIHDAKLTATEQYLLIENSTNFSGLGAIFHQKIGAENEKLVSILMPITNNEKLSSANNMSPAEVATTLMLASQLSTSRLMQMQNSNEQQQQQNNNNLLTVTRCNLHPDGKSAGVECPKCDLILGSSRSLGGHITMMHSRNSCKTLKCPKCNWHYKYQETLEIHMNEKHNDAPTSCVYCVSNAPHPRLGRGEQWSCGYKPYRCDVCKYSTTTKGNLAIHMQSDKHLNNVQEMHQGKLCNTSSPVVPIGSSVVGTSTNTGATATSFIPSIVPPTTTIVGLQPSSHHVHPQSSSTSSLVNTKESSSTSSSTTPTSTPKTKPSWRCDFCNYETNVMRNLRIHTTSEKHAQNLLMLQQSVKNYQQQQNSQQFHQHHHRPSLDLSAAFASTSATSATTSNAAAASLLNFSTPTCPDDVLSSKLALNLQNIMFQSVLNDGKMFQCCICMSFACDTLAELISHSQNTDRSRPNETDVTILSGNYICNLCHYKTHLKANFQLHTKTDKHLQRLQLVNHVREGGPQNEVRMKYLNPNNPIQLRCVACNEFANSFHKLQMHLSTNRHRSYATSYEKISFAHLSSANCLYCTLCDYVTSEKHVMLTHLHSEGHSDLLHQILPVIESSGDVEQNPLNWIEIRDKTDEKLSDLDEDEDIENDDDIGENYVDVRRQTMTDDAGYCCAECNFCFDTEEALELHVQQEHQRTENGQCNKNDDSVSLMCPLCKTNCGTTRERLECHLTEVHKVPSDRVQPLLNLLPMTSTEIEESLPQQSSSSWKIHSGGGGVGGYICQSCDLNFDDVDALFVHQQTNLDHVEKIDASSSMSTTTTFVCWASGCKENFNTLQSVQNHYRNKHVVVNKKCNSNSFDTLNNCKCAICGRTFVSNFLLDVHVERSHGSKIANNNNCSENNKQWNNNYNNNGKNFSSSSTDSSPKLNGVGELSPDSNNLIINEDPNQDNNFAGSNSSSVLAETNYNDANRPYKCEKCKVAFTQQLDLTLHNRTLQHRQGTTTTTTKQCVTTANNNNSNNKICESYSSLINEKFNDPNRPFKCDICKESFTQKNILLVHYNSVSHLNKKNKLDAQSSSHEFVHGTSKSLPSNLSNDSSETTKKFKCNICKVAYTSANALDAHLRSVGHQTQFNRLFELVINGEIDFTQPLIEHPTATDDNRSTTIANQQNFVGAATFNPFLNLPKSNEDVWQQLFNSVNAGTSNDEGGNKKTSSSPMCQPLTNLEQIVRSNINKSFSSGNKTGLAFRKMLENYGFEVVMQYNEAHHRKRSKSATNIVFDSPSTVVVNENDEPETKKSKKSDEITDGSPPELAKCKCTCCEKEFSSVWVLKAHMEQVHKCLIPVNEVEKVSEEFKQVYDKKFNSNLTDEVGDNVARRSVTNTPSSLVGDNNTTLPGSSTNKLSSQSSAAVTSQPTPTSTIQNSTVSAPQINPQMAAMMMGLGLGVQFPFIGVPFNPFAVPNPYGMLMMPSAAAGFDPLSFVVASSASQSSLPMTNLNSSKSVPAPVVAPPTASSLLVQQQAKRARTRITDDQLKVLREYFDINNSPTEEQIEEMSRKSGLPQKVIKHWFRNTLFKERQRSKDSPYNFNIPPSLGIDLEEYEKTGEAKIIPYNVDNDCSGGLSKTIVTNGSEQVESKLKSIEEQKPNECATPVALGNGIKQKVSRTTESSPQGKLVGGNFNAGLVKKECHETLEEDDEYDEYENDHDLSGTNSADNCFNKLNAHETFRQLAAVSFSAMQMPPFLKTNNGGASSSGRISPLSSLLSQHAALQNQTTPNSATSDLTNMIANALSPNNNGQLAGGGGRRANRTRFTEWQVKTLQEFFDRNAYPKDDDLEVLSNKLNLSPRVIVVWFQNARQKARKIYENLPAECDDRFVRTPGLNYQCKKCRLVFQRYYELIKHQKTVCFKDETKFDNGDQSPPLHHGQSSSSSQSSRFKSNSIGSQNHKSTYSSQQEQQNLTTSHQKSTKNGVNGNLKCNECGACFNATVQLEEHLKLHANALMINEELGKSSVPPNRRNSFDQAILQSFEENSGASDFRLTKHKIQTSPDKFSVLDQKYSINTNPSPKTVELISLETGLSKNVVNSWFQHSRSKDNKPNNRQPTKNGGTAVSSLNNNSNNSSSSGGFNKRCPFCAILFHSKSTMESHLHSKHSSQWALLNVVDVINLPDAEEVPTITTVPLTEAMWNAAKAAGVGDAIAVSSQSVLTLGTGGPARKSSGNDLSSIIERLAPCSSGKYEETPLDLSRSLKQQNQSSLSDEVANCSMMNNSNNRTPSNNSNEDDVSYMMYEENDDSQSFYSQDSPSNSPQHQYLAALARPQKRFRTRLTPQQIRVMKFLFNDFKTPTMSECEILGNEMGLHKRVVQVWFQNARAKERKAKLATGGSSANEGNNEMKLSPPKCFLCDVVYTGRMSMQDHSFSKSHIEKIKKAVEEMDDNPSTTHSNSLSPDLVEQRTTTTDVNNSHSSSKHHRTSNESNDAVCSRPVAKVQPNSQHHHQQNYTTTTNNESKKFSPPTSVQSDSSLTAVSMAQNLLPYMYAASNPVYYASMMMPTGFGGLSNGNLSYDPYVHGTPVSLLQIPPNIMQIIMNAMQRGRESFCRFTQDGKNAADLTKHLDVRDRSCVGEKDLEVGWACRTCTTVFQAEALFLNHQLLICHSDDRAFKLIQTHYECKWCNQCFGTQDDFTKHCDSSEHKSNRN